MDEQIKRIVERAFPELPSRLHLPILARVQGISDTSSTPELSDRFRPRYAVDLQVLKANGDVDALLPLYRAVPLPVSMAGVERGMFGFPEPGTVVELAFAFGLPDRPFIRTVLPEGRRIPAIKPGEALMQASSEVFQRADTSGNWHRTTNANILDTCQNMTERVSNILDSLSTAKQLIRVEDGGTVWLGNESHNILQILSDLIQVVSDVANTASSHVHEYTDNGSPLKTQAPDQASDFTGQKSAADALKTTLDPIVE